jgi:hypothetical protein
VLLWTLLTKPYVWQARPMLVAIFEKLKIALSTHHFIVNLSPGRSVAFLRRKCYLSCKSCEAEAADVSRPIRYHY